MLSFKEKVLKGADPSKKKRSSRRKVWFIVGFFAALFVVSAGYAAQFGDLQVKGVVARTYNMNVRFSDVRFPGLIRDGESVSISDDGYSINVVAQLMQPGDSRAIEFQIENIGTQPVRFLNLTMTQDEKSLTGLDITWPDEAAVMTGSTPLTNYILVPSSTSAVFSLYITWDPAAVNVPSGQWRYFSFVMDYENAMRPTE